MQLKLGPQLSMTPQLQLAIKLLQLPALELKQVIQTQLEQNPLLDVDEPSDLTEDTLQMMADLAVPTYAEHLSSSKLKSDNHQEIASKELSQPTGHLQDYLRWQANLTLFSDRERLIADFILYSIDERGYLVCEPEELLDTICHQAFEEGEERPSLEEILIVLHRIQQFDPPGVGARNTQECLLLQAKQRQLDETTFQLICTLIQDYLPDLAKKQYSTIQARLGLEDKQLKALLGILHSFTPNPGQALPEHNTPMLIPDLILKHTAEGFHLFLNPTLMPTLKINTHYSQLIKRKDNSRDNLYLKNALQEAKWFLKSLLHRNETLLRVAEAIVIRQSPFFELGQEHMKPLVLRDIAEALSLHESTISRLTNGKYIFTPRGTFELKYFFSSHVKNMKGDFLSSTAVQALIKKVIANEPTQKPLSDASLVSILSKQGIQIARRTIAKYREQLSIPPSHERKYAKKPGLGVK